MDIEKRPGIEPDLFLPTPNPSLAGWGKELNVDTA